MIEILSILLDFIPKIFACTPFLIFVATAGVYLIFCLVYKLINS